MKLHWTPNMMTFVGSILLGLLFSLAFIATVRGHGGGAFAFIIVAMVGTGMVVAGLLLKHDNHFSSDREGHAKAPQVH